MKTIQICYANNWNFDELALKMIKTKKCYIYLLGSFNLFADVYS